jgi:outer membrane receptor protein involved in Fe transport
MNRVISRLVAGAAALFVSGLFAQGASDPESAPLVLEEVVVTATKRESLLQNTALSLGVMTGEQLAELGASSVHDYWRQIPSLVVSDQAFGGDRITIRGLGEEPIGIAESMTSVYFDETPVLQADGLFTMSPDFQLVDISRIEVLRGPQGTLFGASAMGGALRVITNVPDPQGIYGHVEGGLSSTSHGGINYQTSAVWNQPVGESSAVRFVGYYSDEDGWIDDIGIGVNNVNSRTTGGVRLAATWGAADRLRITAKLQHQERDIDGYNAVDPIGKAELGIFTTGDYQRVGFSPQFRNDEATLFSLTAEYAADWGDWIYIGSWTDYRTTVQIDLNEEARYLFLGAYAPIISITDYDQEAFIQELRVTSKPESKLQWLGGVFYLDQDVPRIDQFVWFDNPVFPDDAFSKTVNMDTRRDWGIFGELSWPLTGSLTGTIGARWYDIEKDSAAVVNGPNTGFQDVETSLEYSEDGITPKASLAWQVRESTMLYALASKGFRAGGANTPLAVTQCGAPSAFESDDLVNYELGLKMQAADRRMSLNLSVYTIDWSDAQTEINVPDCGNIYVINAGEASSDGIEVEWAWLVMDNWALRAVAGYNDSEITESVPGSRIPVGAKIPLVPDITAAVSTQHYFELFGHPGAFVRADWQYAGDTQTSLFPSLNIEQDAYSLFSLRLGYESARWSGVLFVDNLFDEQASMACCRTDGGFVTNRPRTWGIRARFHY